MPANRISAALSATEQQEVMSAIATIRQKLSFLVDLSPEERKSLAKLGDRNRAFTRKVLEIATQNPDFLPRSFNLEEMRRDLELFEALQPMLLALTHLQELIDDTAVAAGGEAYTAALEVYRYAKANGTVAGLDNLVDEMGQRFSQQTNRGKSAAARNSSPTANPG
ncbi:hypothetical protein K9N68_16420 [Kovacikia minuta CCNUW1]|uniref:hypothetical protein n=1 Tax=Kovacikia minuta TaxID=2931930 RepID=UPI001CCE69F4|nr:hypothetical protein [Kovacikia minuta]UBF29274.1 hypothetical protein K9N68_16420 [Kovacikia minuta CCNUW1]